MKKPARPASRPRTCPAHLLPTAVLEEVRGGQRRPIAASASDDWMAPVTYSDDWETPMTT